jgi:hypothetical protein
MTFFIAEKEELQLSSRYVFSYVMDDIVKFYMALLDFFPATL